MSGEVGHFELPADNPERARKFYQATFGWKMEHMPQFEYTMVQTGEVTKEGRPKNPGFINGGMAKRESPITHPVLTLIVDDIDKTLKVIEKNGGKTLIKKQPIGDGAMGFTAYFHDSEGNTMGLYQAGSMMQGSA